MMLFVLIAVVLSAVALLCVLRPLLRGAPADNVADVSNAGVLQDQLHELDADLKAGTLNDASYAGARKELEQRIAGVASATTGLSAPAQRRMALGLALFVPAAAAALYWLIGAPTALDPQKLIPPPQSQEIGQEQILAMVQRLAEKMKQQPGDAQGWNMLARSYFELRRFQDASDAYSRLAQLAPDNADYLASYALTMALARSKNLQGEPEQLLQRALKLDPKNIRALSLMGSAAFDRRDYDQAIAYWNQVLPLVASDSTIAKSTSSSIDEAKALQKESAKTSIIRVPDADNKFNANK